MADNLRHQFFLQLAEADSPAVITSTNTGAFTDVPVLAFNFGWQSSLSVTDVDTWHDARGVKYSILSQRNQDSGTAQFACNPETMGLLLPMAVDINATSSLPDIHHARLWWTNTGLTGSGTGKELTGVIGNGITLAIDRQSNQAITLGIEAFIRGDQQLTSGVPTPTFPTQDPYTSANVYVDLEIADSSGSFTAWTGDRSNLRSCNLQFSQNVELDVFKPSSTAALNGVWSKAYAGTQSLTFDAVLIFDSTVDEDLHRIAGVRKARVRIMGVGSAPSGSTTTTDTETAGSSKVFTVASTTGFAVNDYVLIDDADNNAQAVALLTAVSASASTLTVDVLDADIDGSGATAATIRNTAWELKASKMDVRTPPVISDGGAVATLSLSLNGLVEAGEETILSQKSYNDNGS